MYLAIISAFLLGLYLSRILGGIKRASWVSCGRAMLVGKEQSSLTFEEHQLESGEPIPVVRIGFSTSVFNIKKGRRYFKWRRFKQDPQNSELAASLKAWKYRAWIDSKEGKINLSPTFDQKKGLLLYLPPWCELTREELNIKEDFLVPILEYAYASGNVAAVQSGGKPIVQTIAFDNVKTLLNEDFTFNWSRVPKEKEHHRMIHNAVSRVQKFVDDNEGFGKEAEDHPIIKAARSRLEQSAKQPAKQSAKQSPPPAE